MPLQHYAFGMHENNYTSTLEVVGMCLTHGFMLPRHAICALRMCSGNVLASVRLQFVCVCLCVFVCFVGNCDVLTYLHMACQGIVHA